jgi:hypothetical protein
MRDRLIGALLLSLVAITGGAVLILRLAPPAADTAAPPQAVSTPTVSPYAAAEIASQYVLQTYRIPPGDLQIADASRKEDPETGRSIWLFRFVDRRDRRAYEIAVDDQGRVVRSP